MIIEIPAEGRYNVLTVPHPSVDGGGERPEGDETGRPTSQRPYRKAWAKLRVERIRTSQERVRRLMPESYA